MKKTAKKKLVLAKETLRDLKAGTLNNAAGGTIDSDRYCEYCGITEPSNCAWTRFC